MLFNKNTCLQVKWFGDHSNYHTVSSSAYLPSVAWCRCNNIHSKTPS